MHTTGSEGLADSPRYPCDRSRANFQPCCTPGSSAPSHAVSDPCHIGLLAKEGFSPDWDAAQQSWLGKVLQEQLWVSSSRLPWQPCAGTEVLSSAVSRVHLLTGIWIIPPWAFIFAFDTCFSCCGFLGLSHRALWKHCQFYFKCSPTCCRRRARKVMPRYHWLQRLCLCWGVSVPQKKRFFCLLLILTPLARWLQ